MRSGPGRRCSAASPIEAVGRARAVGDRAEDQHRPVGEADRQVVEGVAPWGPHRRRHAIRLGRTVALAARGAEPPGRGARSSPSEDWSTRAARRCRFVLHTRLRIQTERRRRSLGGQWLRRVVTSCLATTLIDRGGSACAISAVRRSRAPGPPYRVSTSNTRALGRLASDQPRSAIKAGAHPVAPSGGAPPS